MSKKQGPIDALAREAFLAALEFGVSPLLNSSYGPMRGRELHTVAPKPKKVVGPRLQGVQTRPARKTRKGVVTAEDILNWRGGVL
jgi:hypothetical protein